MTHYSNNPGRVRVDLFKDTGKWYTSGSVDMAPHYDAVDIHAALLTACEETFDGATQEGWPLSTPVREWLANGGTIVCLHPYHQHSHPIMLTQAEVALRSEDKPRPNPHQWDMGRFGGGCRVCGAKSNDDGPCPWPRPKVTP